MADRYWVGGTESWDTTAGTKWALTSGGTGGEAVPTASDDVFFDAASGAVTVTVAQANTPMNNLDFTGFTGTFAGSQAILISGSLTLATGMTRSYTGAITFNSTATGKTLTFNGKTTTSAITFDGTGGGWTVQDAWSNTSLSITLTKGSLDTNDQTITCGSFTSSNSNTRTLDLGSSTINCTAWSVSTTTNLTFTVGTSTLALTGVGGGTSFQGGGLTYNIVTITKTTTGTITITGASTFATLTLTGPTSKTQEFSLSANQTVSGTLTIAGNSLTNRLLIKSSTLGTARTITAATTTLSNVDFQDITGAGAGSWSGTSIGNALGNSGITFTTPVTRYAVVAGNWSSTATWSTSSGGSGGSSVPLCHDTVILDGSSGAGTYVADMPRWGADITMTGFTRTLSTSAFDSYIFGSITFASGMTLTDTTENYYLQGRSSHTITTAGKDWGGDTGTFIDSFGGTYTLQDDWTHTLGYISLRNGTFDANDNDITTTYFVTSQATTRVLTMGSGTWTLTLSSGLFWAINNSTGLTINRETSTIVSSSTSTSSKTFAGGSLTYYNLTLTGAGVCNYTFSGSNTFNTFSSTKTVAHGLVFTAGTTQTVTNWSVVGTAGNVVTINSTSTGTHTLTKSGGGRITSDYLNIQHSIATPSNTWYAGLNSTDNQATATAGSGWLFTVPLPTVTTQAVSSITDVNAVGNGTVTDNGEGIVSRRGFVLHTATFTDPGNVDPDTLGKTVFTESGTFSEVAYTLSLTGLTESTTYYVRAFCENQAGFDYGDEVNFTTEATPLSPTLTTEAVSSITGTGGTGNGTIVEDNGSTVTERGMVASTTSHSSPSNTAPADSDYEFVFTDTGTFTEGAFTKAITGLSNGTLYYVRAYAENGVGFDYGNEVSFTTLNSPTVTIQTPTNRQSTTATLNGTITDDGGGACTARGFNYGTATGVYGTTVTENGSFNEGTFDIDITGLVQNTTYFVRAYTTNALGTSYSSEIQFSTNTFPNTTAVTNLNTNSVTLQNQITTQSAIINQSTNSVTIDNIEL